VAKIENAKMTMDDGRKKKNKQQSPVSEMSETKVPATTTRERRKTKKPSLLVEE
jgi:hypothetical protein